MFALTFWNFTGEFSLVVFLVLLSGFFVAAEFAIVKIRVSQLRTMKKSGDPRVRFALHVNKNLNAYLSATQIGITLTNLALGATAEPFIAEWLEEPLKQLPFLQGKTLEATATVIAFGLMTFALIVVGELMPKMFAIQRPKLVTLWVSPPLFVIYWALWPFIHLLNGTASLLLRLIGLKNVGEGDHALGLEELQYVLMNATHAHPADELINKIMIKALRLKETTAEHVMYGREKISVLWRDKPLQENFLLAQRAGYSRMPVCGESLDEVVGVLHVKELLWQYIALGESTNLMSLVRPVLTFLPKTKLPVMLELFRKSRNHLAVVVDREDRMVGIVSFEDVLEELVGDIRDEFDIEKGPFFERSPDAVLVDADLALRDVAMEMNWPLPTDTTLTVNDWALKQWNRQPLKGETLQTEHVILVAEEVTARGLRRVRLIRDKTPAPLD
jgi:CBS domain containing-hemolysin-like protein